MKKYFAGINKLEDLKKEYRKLALKHHPDKSQGSEDIMKEINNQYEKAFEQLKKQGTKESARDLMDIIDKLIKYDTIGIEIVGTWVWVDGKTYPIKEELKSLGFKWSSKNKKWYWTNGDHTKKKATKYSFQQVREYHGSEVIKENKAKKQKQIG